jgi:hypothetical protein
MYLEREQNKPTIPEKPNLLSVNFAGLPAGDKCLAGDDTLSLIIPFGRYRGQPVSSLPTSYIAWLVRKNFLYGDLRAAVWKEAGRRSDPHYTAEPREEGYWAD